VLDGLYIKVIEIVDVNSLADTDMLCDVAH